MIDILDKTKRSFEPRINEHKNNKNIEFVVFKHQAKFNHEHERGIVKIVDYKSDYKKG